MPRFKKHEQLSFLCDFLARYPDGLSEQRIAQIMNTDRRNVNNYLRELEAKGRVKRTGTKYIDTRWKTTRR
jgi:predicted transcriptional regulator